MASVKQLKKNVSNLTGELFMECVFCKSHNSSIDSSKIDEIIVNLFEKHDEFLKRTKHVGGKNNPILVKQYYKKLKADFNNHLENTCLEIQNLHK